MEEKVFCGNNDAFGGLELCFDDNIDLFYGLNYCINRRNQTPKVYNTKEQTPIIQDFYELFQEESNSDIERAVFEMGEFQNIAIAAMSAPAIDCPALRNYLKEKKAIKQCVIRDIQEKPGLDRIDFNSIKDFYGFNLSDKIIVYLSFFVSGGFGFLSGNKSIIVLGVKYDSEKDSYGVSGTLVCKLIHEFSHPYIKEIVLNHKLSLAENKDIPPKYYKENYLEEILVRVMEIIFSSKIFGEEYEKWATDEQLRAGFTVVPRILKLYYDNFKTINNITDFIHVLIKEKIIVEKS